MLKFKKFEERSRLTMATPQVGESPTHRVGESFFDYEYLHEFEARSGTARKVV
jgi:hypothetical protein